MVRFLLLNSRVKSICWSESWSWWCVFPKCYVKFISETCVFKTQISVFKIARLVVDFVRLYVVAHPLNTAGKPDIYKNNSSFISVLWSSKSFMLKSNNEIWSFIFQDSLQNCQAEFCYDLLRFVYIKIIIILKCTVLTILMWNATWDWNTQCLL